MILITGATGFVGSKFKNLERKDLAYVVRRPSCLSSSEFKNSFSVNSIGANTSWDGAFDNITAIIHLAGLAHNARYSEEDYMEVNYHGTMKLAREASLAGVKRFVFVSSIGVNGFSTNSTPFKSNSEVKPYNAYTRSKYSAETGLKAIANETGLEIVIVRPTLVYGLNAPGNFGLLNKLINLVPFLPFRLVRNRRCFIAVQNLVELLIICAEHSSAVGHIFLAADGDAISTRQLTDAIAKGSERPLLQLPIPVSAMKFISKLIGKTSMGTQLFGNLEVDVSSTRAILGWVPSYSMSKAMAELKGKKND